jgi:hypothetical protein
LASAIASFAADVKVHDSAGSFLRFYDSSKNATEEDQTRRFHEQVFKGNPDFYNYRFSDLKANGRNPEEELLVQIKAFGEYENAFREFYGTALDQLESSVASFAERFPDFRMESEVYLVHSLGLADGTKRKIGGRDVFVVGVDMIARLHPGDNTAFFHHELMHFYHGQYYSQSPALFSHLWVEGLAVYVSQVLNATATQKQLLLADDRGDLAHSVEPVLNKVAAELLADMESRDWRIHNKYFATSSRDPVIPARAGYYIGFLLAKRLSSRYPLPRLISMQDAELLPAVKAELERMRSGASGFPR